MFHIEFYRLSNGKAPVEMFLDGLNIKMRKTPKAEIELAKKYKMDYEHRIEKERSKG
ncbi:MAG: hypothetical protein HDR27_11795 [Lachnospiraceae bacterium]|nr:hypothetical protein [Lachnospiraceae bacterium]